VVGSGGAPARGGVHADVPCDVTARAHGGWDGSTSDGWDGSTSDGWDGSTSDGHCLQVPAPTTTRTTTTTTTTTATIRGVQNATASTDRARAPPRRG